LRTDEGEGEGEGESASSSCPLTNPANATTERKAAKQKDETVVLRVMMFLFACWCCILRALCFEEESRKTVKGVSQIDTISRGYLFFLESTKRARRFFIQRRRRRLRRI
jgi:hypothetical protein